MYRRFIFVLAISIAFGQTDRGNVAGTVLDPSGAATPGASIALVNLATGIQFRTESTQAGVFTLTSVPAGDYRLTVECPGFKTFSQSPIHVQVAQTVRTDVKLEVGATSDSVTVTAEATMLQKDSSEESTTITGDRMNELPLNFAVGPGAIRSPFGFLELVPGASNRSLDVQQVDGFGIDIRVNGMPNNTFKALVDGQDATNPQRGQLAEENQPSNEAIQEFTLQSSNYAAEFGQVAGGLINFTTRSGTNDWHGSAYEYWRNEVLDGGLPYTNDGQGHLIRSRVRQSDFGGSLGGPVWIPKLYNGRGKTFFFFNYEMFRKFEHRYSGMITVPSEAYRNGDFSAALTGRTLGKDSLGRGVPEGTVFDPSTYQTISGVPVTDPFPGNIVPKSRFDPVAVKIQNFFPTPQISGLPVTNYYSYYPNRKIMSIPSVKVDEYYRQAHISVYYSHERVDKDNAMEGLPQPISVGRYQLIRSTTVRLNYDQNIRPTLLNHLGIGLLAYRNPDQTPTMSFNQQQELGLTGAIANMFPNLNISAIYPGGPTLNYGGPNQLYAVTKPTASESLTWVRGAHTYKFGGEWRIDATTNSINTNAQGKYAFASAETSLPTTQGLGLAGGTIGNGYASFLMGLVDNAVIGNPAAVQYRRPGYGFFAQDTWRIRRNVTLDYGLRYDLQPPMHELYDRTTGFDPNLPNPSAGGLPGATVYEGYGPGRCNCVFARTYKYALGPRLGVAWAVTPKWVVRAGWGLSYGQGARESLSQNQSIGFGFNSLTFSNPGYGQAAFRLKDGLQYNLADLTAVDFDPGVRPQPGQLLAALPLFDINGGRPPRINQWSISVQREVSKDLLVSAAYVGNRVVWLQNDSLVNYNAITPERLAAVGLNLNVSADRQLLTSQLGSAAAAARGFKAPYPGFPMTSTVAQSLRPYPQFTNIPSRWAPLGSSWYDSLQVKIVKRLSRGLNASVAYTWSKNLTNTLDEYDTAIAMNDVFNRRNQKSYSAYDQPQVLSTGFRYELPTFGVDRNSRLLRGFLHGWALGGVLRYASGLPIPVPTAQNNLANQIFQGTFANRIPGVPLFKKNLNCGCIDPNKEFALNPAAWSDPAAGQWGFSSAYFGDYRYERRPSESASLGKSWRIEERFRVEFRAEFFNLFNRTVMPNPTVANALATQSVSASGQVLSGFGRINPNNVQVGTQRTGQLVLRIGF